MLYFWIFLLSVSLVIILSRYLRGKQLGDGSMLLFGLSFYCFLPFVAYGTNIYESGPGASVWSDVFQPLYEASFTVAGFFALLISSFLFGNVLPVPSLWAQFNRPISPKVLKVSVALLLVLWMLFIYQARSHLFAGYSVDADVSLAGPLSTINLIAVLILLNIKQWRQSQSVEYSFSIILLVNSLLLLSMGGRMYVLAPAISLFLQYINSDAKEIASRLRLLLVFCIVVLVLLAVGAWRMGRDTDFLTLLTLGLAEPILTSISMAFLYNCSSVAFFEFPYQFLSTIINFIPSGIFPDKANFMLELDPTGTCLFSPFGAVHISAMLLLNFGILGSCIFMVIFALFLKSLRQVNRNGWWLYYYVCGLLPFMFFRDGFQVFNKALVGSGILMALAMIILGRLRVK